MKGTTWILAVVLLAGWGTSAAFAQTDSASAKADSSDLAPPVHPATEAQVRELLTLTHAVDEAHTAMAASLKAARDTSAPYYTAAFWDDMEKAVMAIDIVGPCVPAYQKYFSEEDMASVLAFYRSSAGKRFLDAQPFVGSALSDTLRKAGAEAGMQVGLKHKDEIDRLMKESQAGAAK